MGGCFIGEGVCSSDLDCHGNLICGINNCNFGSPEADCCKELCQGPAAVAGTEAIEMIDTALPMGRI